MPFLLFFSGLVYEQFGHLSICGTGEKLLTTGDKLIMTD
jgi:hypothetical protein